MTDQEIKVGDVVVLKSGGQEMTVASKTDETVTCKWTYQGEVKEHVFKLEELKHIPKYVAPKMPNFDS